MKICAVILENANRSYDKIYHYNVPEEFEKNLETGMRVSVPFGRGNSFRTGYFLAFLEETKYVKLKSIVKILDDVPLISKNMFRLARMMRNRYFCSYGRALSVMLPSGMKIKKEKVVLRKNAKEVSLKVFMLSINGNRNTLKCMMDSGEIKIIEKEHKAARAKTLKAAKLKISPEEASAMIENNEFTNRKHMRVIELLLEFGTITISEFENYESISRQIMKGLEKKGYVEIFDKEMQRSVKTECEITELKKVVLNKEQNEAVQKVSKAFDHKTSKTFLIHGITGSGKTEVYLELTKRTIEKGKQVIVLVPEISLTPMMIRRFNSRFPGQIAILHSRLSMGERYDQWMLIKNKKADIALGARSCIFAPFENLGLVIIDEEHEPSFTSGTTPRYKTGDIAVMRCNLENAVLVAGSATPSVQSYYAQNEKGSIIELKKRAGYGKLPLVSVVDMKEELMAGNTGVFSRKLKKEIADNLKKGNQTLLFLNRRGYSAFFLCRDCGGIIKCRDCDVSMTYHKNMKAMICHYCGYMKPVPKTCPSCGSKSIQDYGIGTQKVEEEIQKEFPGATMIRMDSDATGYKNSHMKILDRFIEEKIDILIGTQMIAKGHDFPNITLVGILAVDTLMLGNDYTSQERAFQLITQAAGRAGRGVKPGKAIIQAYNTDAYAIEFGVKQDYISFYKKETELRKSLGYPPFGLIGKILFTGISDTETKKCAEAAAGMLEYPGMMVSNAAYAPVSRINRKYRYRVVARSDNAQLLRRAIKGMYLKMVDKMPVGITFSIEIDGDNML